MTNTRYYSILVLILTISCSRMEETDYRKNTPLSIEHLNSSNATELQGVNTSLMNNEAVYVYNLLIIDSLLIVHNSTPAPYFYSLYNLKNEKKIKSFGKQGKGPGELPDFSMSTIVSEKDASIGIMIPNEGGIIYKAYLDSLINNPSYSPSKVASLGFQYNNSYIVLNDSNLFALSLQTEERITRLNLNGEVLESTLSYPFEKELGHFPKDLFGMIFQGLIVKNEPLKRGAIFTMMSPNLDIFEFRNDSIKLINQTHLGFPKVFDESNLASSNITNRSVSYSNKNKIGFVSVTSTDDYIYALYSGRTAEKYKGRHFFGEIVLVLDWNGNLVNKLKLDEEAYAIVVSSDDKTLYTVQETSDTNLIRKYQLPHENK